MRIVVCCCLLLLNLAGLSAAAADTLERIRERGHLRVAVKNDGNPDRAAHKDPAHFDKRDFEVDLAHALAAALLGDASKVEFVMVRKPERIPAVASGKVDLAISMLRPEPRHLAEVDFSQPYYDAGVAVMQGRSGRIAKAQELVGRRIGVIARNDAEPHAMLARVGRADGPAALREFEHFDAAADALKQGDIDALFSESANIDVYVKAHAGQFVCSPPLSIEPVAVALPKGDTALLIAVNGVIDELRASGKLDAMQRAHGLR